MDDDTISPMGKVVYWYLTRIASSGDHRGRVGISAIGAKIGLPAAWRRTVLGCLDELVRAGWLEVVHRVPPNDLTEPSLDYVIHAEATAVPGRSIRSPEKPTVSETPAIDPTALRIVAGHLVENTGECNCNGPEISFGVIHEHGCGQRPLTTVAELAELIQRRRA